MGPTDTTERRCEECGERIEASKNKKARFCKIACAQAKQIREWQSANKRADGVNLDTNSVAEIGKMAVIHYLVRAGYEVFRAVTKRSCDLLVLVDGRPLRVDVVTGYFGTNGALQYPRKELAECHAVVVKLGEVITFEPPLESFASLPCG